MDIKEIVRLVIEEYKSNFGKGPSAVRVHIDDNCLYLTIKGSLTTMEKTALNISESSKTLIWNMRKLIIDHVLLVKYAKRLAVYGLAVENYTFEFDYQNDQQVMIIIFNKPLQIKD